MDKQCCGLGGEKPCRPETGHDQRQVMTRDSATSTTREQPQQESSQQYSYGCRRSTAETKIEDGTDNSASNGTEGLVTHTKMIGKTATRFAKHNRMIINTRHSVY